MLHLASPSGCEGLLLLAGGGRCARPPATCCHPFRMKLFWGRAPPKQLYVGITFQQASASGGLDLGVIAERFPKLSSGVAMY